MIILSLILLCALAFVLGMITGSTAERSITREEKSFYQMESDSNTEVKNFLNYDGTEQE